MRRACVGRVGGRVDFVSHAAASAVRRLALELFLALFFIMLVAFGPFRILLAAALEGGEHSHGGRFRERFDNQWGWRAKVHRGKLVGDGRASWSLGRGGRSRCWR